jgi:hypothetical protein
MARVLNRGFSALPYPCLPVDGPGHLKVAATVRAKRIRRPGESSGHAADHWTRAPIASNKHTLCGAFYRWLPAALVAVETEAAAASSIRAATTSGRET